MPTREYVASRNATEEDLAAIWTSLLGTDRVGAEDDFFALGGHSLLLAQMATRIAEELGVDIALHEFFSAATLSPMAAPIVAAQSAELGEQEAAGLIAEARQAARHPHGEPVEGGER